MELNFSSRAMNILAYATAAAADSRTIKRGNWRVTETEEGNPSSRTVLDPCMRKEERALTYNTARTRTEQVRRPAARNYRRFSKFGKVKKDLPRNCKKSRILSNLRF